MSTTDVQPTGGRLRPATPDPQAVRQVLQKTFGLSRLRDGQEAVIARVLRGLSTLAVMPTGSGKSLCYQLPALLMAGRTLVVSPLIALMKDQADALSDLGIPAAQWHSGLAAAEEDAAETSMRDGTARIIFTTPERATDPAFARALGRYPVSLVVVDEAHCLSQWGHDFRPAYLALDGLVKSLGRPGVLALTATATSEVIADITSMLDIPRSGVVDTGVYRPNLRFRVEHLTRTQDKLPRLIEIVAASPGSVLIYTATVKAAEAVFAALQEAGEADVGLYHGKLGATRRRESQDAFMDGRVRVMVATNAFGLGVDKPDVRWLLHYQMPGGLDAYYQEAGRAGRDGERAECCLLFVDADRSVQQFFLNGRYPALSDFEAAALSLRADPQGDRSNGMKAVTGSGEARHTGGERKRAVALNVLCKQGAARAAPDGSVHATLALDDAKLADIAARYGERVARDRAMLERMVDYAQSGRCRWRLLLDHFDDAPALERCGHCDNCQRMAAHEATSQQDETADAAAAHDSTAPAAPIFAQGQTVRTRRHGRGRVVSANALMVTIEFGNGEQRSFLPRFVQPLQRRRPG